ncbi:MAG TPA: hypothetical protein VNF74_02135 [Terriglobales bacterium]|nr:hypothetical protein [Terriglobales bacterium]
MIDRRRRLRADFAFETTLSGLKADGHRLVLFYLRLPSVELARVRVRARVQAGGHNIPEPVVRRRFERSLENFFQVYRRMADTWRLMDSSSLRPDLLAACEFGETRTQRPETWRDLESHYNRRGSHSPQTWRTFRSASVPTDLALQAAAEDAIAEHARSSVPLVVWQDGLVVELDARALLPARGSGPTARSAPR